MYSTDVIKDDFYITAARSSLGAGEIAALKRSIPDAGDAANLLI